MVADGVPAFIAVMMHVMQFRAPFDQAEKIRARINSSFAYEDR